jgi:hypothetical protein
VAEVEVDEETGFVDVKNIWVAHDCGRALNPVLVEGQMEGSAYMGFAEAIFEEQVFKSDREGKAGLHNAPSLLDYRLPTSLDTPDLHALIVESVDPEGPYGAKEAGEGPLHPSIPAIANAIYDAVGVRIDSLPFSPSRVWRALRAAEGAELETATAPGHQPAPWRRGLPHQRPTQALKAARRLQSRSRLGGCAAVHGRRFTVHGSRFTVHGGRSRVGAPNAGRVSGRPTRVLPRFRPSRDRRPPPGPLGRTLLPKTENRDP